MMPMATCAAMAAGSIQRNTPAEIRMIAIRIISNGIGIISANDRTEHLWLDELSVLFLLAVR